MTTDVLVVGSLHRDVVVNAPRLPMLDETLPGTAFRLVSGGKGGNQAVAAARLGARTAMAGRIGNDAFGSDLLAHLDAAGIDRARVTVDPGAVSGMSVAIVDDNGNYGAVIVSGANLNLQPAEAEDAVLGLRPRVLVLQNEIPSEVNHAAAAAAAASGTMVMLNAAPARDGIDRLMDGVDFLVVNRGEAAAMTGAAMDTPDDAVAAARALAAGKRLAVVTLGGEGAAAVTADGRSIRVPAVQVPVLSTHGAGDMFVGGLAARIAAGAATETALAFAAAAAALHVSRDDAGRAAINAEAAERLAANLVGRRRS